MISSCCNHNFNDVVACCLSFMEKGIFWYKRMYINRNASRYLCCNVVFSLWTGRSGAGDCVNTEGELGSSLLAEAYNVVAASLLAGAVVVPPPIGVEIPKGVGRKLRKS